jgi:hypothetical protein
MGDIENIGHLYATMDKRPVDVDAARKGPAHHHVFVPGQTNTTPQSFPPENAHARASDVRFRETKDDIDGRIPITLHL